MSPKSRSRNGSKSSAAPRALTPQDLWSIPRVGAPAPSPDGRWVVVPVTTASIESNRTITRLWLVPGEPPAARRIARGVNAPAGPDGGAPFPLTTPEASSTQPAWSPDGRHIVFLRKPGMPRPEEAAPGRAAHPDQAQLYLLSIAGGEPERLTDLPLGAADPRWFPAGRRIAFIAPVFGDAASIEETAKRAEEREKDPVKANVSESRVYRFWDGWHTRGIVHHIFALDLRTRTLVDLTPQSRRWFDLMDPCDQYSIAPDGREVAFAACRTEPPYDRFLWGVFTVRLTAGFSPAGPARCLTPNHPADAVRPVYSPDGRWIIYGMQREPDFYADRVRLVAYDRRTRRHTVLTEGWDFSAAGWAFGRDSRTLFLQAETRARTGFYSFDLPRAMRKPDKATPRLLVRGGTLTGPFPAGGRLFASLSSLSQPPEVVSAGELGRGLRRLTRFTDSAMSAITPGEVEEEHFTGADGRRVQMFLVHPPLPQGRGRHGSRPDRRGPRPPLVHMIHGGPHGAFHDEWHWRWNAQAFAAPGYLVALVNFHGSTGWGQSFAASILGRWGDQPYRDVMAATDHLIAQGRVDPRRMAATGGSYGGYLASWIASQTDRFACIINHAGVSDFQTQMASDVTHGRPRSMGGELWDNIEGMDRWNPIRHAAGFRSPMLVIHGERDYRVPYAQGLAVYNVYKAMKLPARLVCYPDENHWVLKPRNSLHWYGEVLSWLERWVGAGRRVRRADPSARRANPLDR
jgi:dipeptidyl aminopeptidase/acylaminoacyl peptidase